MRLARELEIALTAVREASRLTRAVQARLDDGSRLTKDDRSPVTVADFGAQALVASHLQRAFPADPVVGEEDSSALRSGPELLGRVLEAVRAVRGEVDEARLLAWIDHAARRDCGPRFWTLDPIDGTKGFLRKEQYAIGLALIEGGRPVLAALASPALDGGKLFWAVRGEGAWEAPLDRPDAAPAPMRASPERDPARLRIVMSVDPSHSDQERTLEIARRVGIAAPPRRLDSLTKYALVARGEAEVYFRIPRTRDRQENIWDHASGTLLVEAAGGAVTDLDGRPLDFGCGPTLANNRGVLASNGPLHAELLAALAATEPGA